MTAAEVLVPAPESIAAPATANLHTAAPGVDMQATPSTTEVTSTNRVGDNAAAGADVDADAGADDVFAHDPHLDLLLRHMAQLRVTAVPLPSSARSCGHITTIIRVFGCFYDLHAN